MPASPTGDRLAGCTAASGVESVRGPGRWKVGRPCERAGVDLRAQRWREVGPSPIPADDQLARRRADHPDDFAPAGRAPHHRAPSPSGRRVTLGAVTGHPPTHGRRAGTGRADGPRAGKPTAADAHADHAHARDDYASDEHVDKPRAGEQGWAALHGGIRPSALVRIWLRGVQRLAAGSVARVSPDALSAAGIAAAGGAAIVAAQGGRWPLVAAALVVLAGVLDGLDGAVALHTGRARPLGAVVDAMADRVGDLLLVATLAVLGAPPAWCVAAGALTLLHEYLRARAGAAATDDGRDRCGRRVRVGAAALARRSR